MIITIISPSPLLPAGSVARSVRLHWRLEREKTRHLITKVDVIFAACCAKLYRQIPGVSERCDNALKMISLLFAETFGAFQASPNVFFVCWSCHGLACVAVIVFPMQFSFVPKRQENNQVALKNLMAMLEVGGRLHIQWMDGRTPVPDDSPKWMMAEKLFVPDAGWVQVGLTWSLGSQVFQSRYFPGNGFCSNQLHNNVMFK